MYAVGIRGKGALLVWRIQGGVGGRGEVVVVVGFVEWRRWLWSGWVMAFFGKWVLGMCFSPLLIRGSAFGECAAGD